MGDVNLHSEACAGVDCPSRYQCHRFQMAVSRMSSISAKNIGFFPYWMALINPRTGQIYDGQDKCRFFIKSPRDVDYESTGRVIKKISRFE
jgi:hypothetical protein